jgi:hypothetical protein
MKTINHTFSNVGLSLKPWDRRDEISGMDIAGDDFLLAEGTGNTIRVVATDASMQQIVVIVHEHRRSFHVDVPIGLVLPIDKVIKRRPGNGLFTVERRTTEDKRSLLLGLDEMGHPFVSQLNRGVRSVQDAHEALKPDDLQGLRVRVRVKNYRRGRKRTPGGVAQCSTNAATRSQVGLRSEHSTTAILRLHRTRRIAMSIALWNRLPFSQRHGTVVSTTCHTADTSRGAIPYPYVGHQNPHT